MPYPYFFHNTEILPADQAVVPLSRVEYSYGFGVYETIRVAHGRPQFLEEHCARLMKSAEIIGLEHPFSTAGITSGASGLLERNQADACNIKILLVGGPSASEASLDILCLNPLFPDRKLYRDGVKATTFHYEREYPQAKTLNMLSSYLAYREARRQNAYDALLIDRQGNVRESTRANFFGLSGRVLVSPPAEQILPGVTRAKVIDAALKNGFSLDERPIPFNELGGFDSLLLTSTSSKILPISQVAGQNYPISEEARALIGIFNEYTEALADPG